jgi:hypothetical protein
LIVDFDLILRILLLLVAIRSYILNKEKNSAGPRTLPYVTPAITLSRLLLHFTLCFLPLWYWAIQDESHDGSNLSILFVLVI